MNEKGKTLIILTPGFPANEADSTCLPFPQLFVKSLRQFNPSLQIIVLAFQYPFVAAEYQWHGVQVIAFNGRNKGKLNRMLIWKAVWKKLRVIIKQNNTAGILSFWLGECGLIGKYAANKYRLNYFTWLLGQDARAGNRYFSLIKPGAKNLVALSDFLAAEFYRNYKIMPDNIVPPGIDTAIVPLPAMKRDIDILGAGSLIPLKQYNIFIKVVALLACTRPQIKAVICGDGPEMQRLQKLIDDTGLSGNIELCGALPHHEVMDIMCRSKIVLHPSSYEGFATVLTEALYAGAHVVGFCQPMDSVFKHQHTVKTPEEMIDKADELLKDENLNHDMVITWPIETTCRKISMLYGI